MYAMGKKYYAHRLAFLYVKGFLPEYEIDHKNRIRHDNKWSNLRHVGRLCNLLNNGLRKDNTSGLPGIGKFRGKYRARIHYEGRSVHLGVYDDLIEAALTRMAVIQCGGETSCNNNDIFIRKVNKLIKEKTI